MFGRTMKFGVAMLALVGLVAVASPAQAALVLYDDFNDAAASAALWNDSAATAAGKPVYDGSTASLTMSGMDEVSLMDSDIAMGLVNIGDTFRMTFDITPTLGSFSFLGARIGVDYEALEWVGAVRHNRRGMNRAYFPDEQEDSANNTIVSGNPYHFDLSAEMTGAGLVDYTVRFYDRIGANDADPDLYDPMTAIDTLVVTGTAITPGQLNRIGLFVGFANGTANTTTQNRGTAVFDNIYTENAVAAIPEPASLVLLGFGLIGLVATRRRVG